MPPQTAANKKIQKYKDLKNCAHLCRQISWDPEVMSTAISSGKPYKFHVKLCVLDYHKQTATPVFSGQIEFSRLEEFMAAIEEHVLANNVVEFKPNHLYYKLSKTTFDPFDSKNISFVQRNNGKLISLNYYRNGPVSQQEVDKRTPPRTVRRSTYHSEENEQRIQALSQLLSTKFSDVILERSIWNIIAADMLVKNINPDTLDALPDDYYTFQEAQSMIRTTPAYMDEGLSTSVSDYSFMQAHTNLPSNCIQTIPPHDSVSQPMPYHAASKTIQSMQSVEPGRKLLCMDLVFKNVVMDAVQEITDAVQKIQEKYMSSTYACSTNNTIGIGSGRQTDDEEDDDDDHVGRAVGEGPEGDIDLLTHRGHDRGARRNEPDDGPSIRGVSSGPLSMLGIGPKVN